MKLSPDRIEEMLRDCDGVPNGEWTDDKGVRPNISASRRYPIAATRFLYTDLDQIERVTKHVLNCHPDTIRSLLTELLSLREQVGTLTAERDEARAEATAWANKSLEAVGSLRTERDEAQETIGRGIMRLPAGERGGGLLDGISDLRRRAEAAEAELASLREHNERQGEALETVRRRARNRFDGAVEVPSVTSDSTARTLSEGSSNG